MSAVCSSSCQTTNTLVNRNQDANQILHQTQQENLAWQNNLATMVERIMTHNVLNIGLHMPNYTPPLLKYLIHTELPRVGKSLSSLNLLVKLVTPQSNISLNI